MYIGLCYHFINTYNYIYIYIHTHTHTHTTPLSTHQWHSETIRCWLWEPLSQTSFRAAAAAVLLEMPRIRPHETNMLVLL